MPEKEAKPIEVKDAVHTPDGEGKVTDINARYVVVKLGNGELREFAHREVFLDEKLTQAATVKPPEPEPKPVEVPAEIEARDGGSA